MPKLYKVVHRIQNQAHFWSILVCAEAFPSSGRGSIWFTKPVHSQQERRNWEGLGCGGGMGSGCVWLED